MKQIMTKIRTAVLVGAGVVTAGIMGLFGLMILGSVLFLALVLTPLGALAAWALQTGNDTIDATAQDLGDSASDSQAATA
jgi:hypothetical protein